MARKRRTLNICKLRPDRFRDMTSDQLMKIWGRLGASAPTKRKFEGNVKALVVALAVAKDQRRRGADSSSYEKQSERLIQEIYETQQKAGCALPENELVARDAERADQSNTARKLRRKAIIR